MTLTRKTRWITLCCLLAVLSGPLAVLAGDVEHPRLFVTAKKLAAIRKAAAADKTGHHHRAIAALKARVDSGDPTKAYRDHISDYTYSYFAREAALMSQLSTSDAAKKKYADLAYKTIEAIWEKPLKRRPETGYGLSRAMMSLGVGIAYDWCYNQWSDQQRSYVEGKINKALDAWPRYGHANFGDARASNWVAVCRGGEMVLMLAAGQEKARAKRYSKLTRELGLHIRNGFGSLGVSQEGVGYTEYPGGFLMPAAYAAADLGDEDLLKQLRKMDQWKLAMYSQSFQPHERKFLMQGVSGSSNYDEGWVSLLWNTVPEDHKPYYAWFYDRHMGVKAPLESDAARFDANRAGTVWAILYYPTDVTPKDPTGVYPAGAADDRGYYFFRSRWKDENDIQTSIMADTVHHGHAWDQPEQLVIGLMAYNTRFFGGPSKKREDKLYSTLLVDGKYNISKSVRMTGKKVDFQADKTGGYAIVDGGGLYRQLGVSEAKRHMLVEFSKDGSSAIIVTLDMVKSDTEHTYTWQGNLGSEEGDDDIKSSSGKEGGRPTFTLKGRNGGYTKGWVVFPADAEITTGDPLQLSCKGENQNIWVVMVVGRGDQPTAQVSGAGPETKITVGGRTIHYDAKKGKLIAE
jgi:hypothetical protein